MLRQVQAAVQRRHEWGGLPREQREWVIIKMEVQHVKVTCPPPDLLEHRQMQGIDIADTAIKPQSPRPYCLELGRRARISAREQRDIMALHHEFFSQPRNDPFGASVELWWNCLGKRRDLRNAHFTVSLSGRLAPSMQIGIPIPLNEMA